jgi:hypothetical protein
MIVGNLLNLEKHATNTPKVTRIAIIRNAYNEAYPNCGINPASVRYSIANTNPNIDTGAKM